MIDIQALMDALPTCSLEPQCVATIRGLVDATEDGIWRPDTIHFLEPPASRRVPYLDPTGAVQVLLRRQGMTPEAARSRAGDAVRRLKDSGLMNDWAVFYDDLKPDSSECLPVPDFLAWLRQEFAHSRLLELGDGSRGADGLSDPENATVTILPEVVNFLERAMEVAIHTPMFRGPDNWDAMVSLEALPALPPPKAMIEFVPGAPWFDVDDGCETNTKGSDDNAFLSWREAIRPVAAALEQALGEPVYYFADLCDELDDDAVHRFLLLHWCCTQAPDSPLIEHLVERSSARNAHELKDALTDPASYVHPFEMNDALVGLETQFCRFEYPAAAKKTVAFVFSTLTARQAAYELLQQHIGTDPLFVAPHEVLDKQWLKEATVNIDGWSASYMHDGSVLERPVEILAHADRFCVIADSMRPARGFDLRLSESVEDFLWMALELKLDAHYYTPDRMGLFNPERSLERSGAPERVAKRYTQRQDFTRNLDEIRLDNDYGSSGLWDGQGRMLGYDLLDIPLTLLRWIAAWQKDFDDNETPPNVADDKWWHRHAREELEIGFALQAALENHTKVKLYRWDSWLSVDEVAQIEVGSGMS